MARSSCASPLLIGESSLTGWEVIGSGGFGQIYKTRHEQWCYDVAIKVLHYDDGSSSSLLREVDMMCRGSSEYVMQVLGVFKGRLPNAGPSEHLGLVMKFMDKGSLASLQNTIQGAPPLPLVFRLAHQVALGINFLHSLCPSLLHLDLKPSNVLLDSHLNVKLTDFGLAKIYHSVTRASQRSREDEGGTISYMPPEAFEISYTATRASDIYSYGILLWSIVTGKQPYANALSSIVRFRIPQGDRPSLEEFRCQAEGLADLDELKKLMIRCWEADPKKRPSAFDCATITEKLYNTHQDGIDDAVYEVLKKLKQREGDRLAERVQRVQITQVSAHPRVEAGNCCDVPTGRPPVQENVCGLTATQRVNATRFEDLPSPQHANVCRVQQPCSSAAKKTLKASSVHPISSSPLPPSSPRPPPGRAAVNPKSHRRHNQLPQYQRQFSSPVASTHNLPVASKVCIQFSNVTGLQSGINNTMYLIDADHSERRRHPTAPSSVNFQPSPLGSWQKKKSGGVG